MASSTEGRWELGIGDPSTMGWITVAAYLLAAGLAWRNVQAARRTAAPASFWIHLAGVLLVLALNKQLDLQTWFGQTGRDLAMAQGWYEQRRYVQFAFIALLLAGAVGLLIWMRRRWAAMWAEYRGVVAGLSLLLLFIVIRAATFHHIDAVVGVPMAGSTIGRWLEIVAVMVVAAACWRWHEQHRQRIRRFAVERFKNMS